MLVYSFESLLFVAVLGPLEAVFTIITGVVIALAAFLAAMVQRTRYVHDVEANLFFDLENVEPKLIDDHLGSPGSILTSRFQIKNLSPRNAEAVSISMRPWCYPSLDDQAKSGKRLDWKNVEIAVRPLIYGNEQIITEGQYPIGEQINEGTQDPIPTEEARIGVRATLRYQAKRNLLTWIIAPLARGRLRFERSFSFNVTFERHPELRYWTALFQKSFETEPKQMERSILLQSRLQAYRKLNASLQRARGVFESQVLVRDKLRSLIIESQDSLLASFEYEKLFEHTHSTMNDQEKVLFGLCRDMTDELYIRPRQTPFSMPTGIALHCFSPI